MAIAAIQSGAHVYVEKPIGHTIEEGRAMVKAAGITIGRRKWICAVASQRTTGPGWNF